MRKLAFALTLLASALLVGCGRPTYTYSYKLTLEVETPEGIRRGLNVVELTDYTVGFPHEGVRQAGTGEALYLDLGSGRRPLVALLTKTVKEYRDLYSYALLRAYDLKGRWDGTRNPDLETLQTMRGAREIPPSELPDLVTFSNINDPKSVIAVDPNDLEATLGPGVKWHRITLEITDEPVTTGIEGKLPWTATMKDGYLDGASSSRRLNLANSLQIYDFKRWGF